MVHSPVGSTLEVRESSASGRILRVGLACGMAGEAAALQEACWTVRPQQASLWGHAKDRGRWIGELTGGRAPLRWNVI